MSCRRGLHGSDDEFPRDVIELMEYFAPQPRTPVRAVPGTGLQVPVWILGSSLYGAQLAAALGLPYAFASHFAPAQLMDAIALYRQEFSARGIALPPAGDYAVATCFFGRAPARRRQLEAILEAAVVHHGQRVIGWRDVPIDERAIGPVARGSRPAIRQLFIARTCPPDELARVLYKIGRAHV